MARWLLPTVVLLVVILAACGGGSNQGEEIRNDLAAIQAAINQGEFGSLYEDFSAAACKGQFAPEAFVANFERDPFQLTDVQLLEQNIVIDRGMAYIILTATFRYADGSGETTTFPQTLVKEDGHWRDSDCFLGGLGGPR